MARDHALAELATRGEGVLRFYAWDRPTISFGRNEPARRLYDPAAVACSGYGLVRRPTGGGTVLHDAELTYAVVIPDRSLGGARRAYSLIGASLAEGLIEMGVPAEAITDAPPATPRSAGPCFADSAPGEVVSGGRKLVGSAQARIGGALLQHGSILLDGDQDALSLLARETGNGQMRPKEGGVGRRGFGHQSRVGERPGRAEARPDQAEARPSRTVATRHATIRGLIGDRTPDEVRAALTRAFQERLGGRWERGTYTAAELERARVLARERYRSPDWCWRR